MKKTFPRSISSLSRKVSHLIVIKLIPLLLLSPTQGQEGSEGIDSNDGNLVNNFPHIHQGKGSGYCASAAVLGALQMEWEIDLSDPRFLSSLTGIVDGNNHAKSSRVDKISRALGINFNQFDYNSSTKLSNKKSVTSLAKEKLENTIAAHLNRGLAVTLMVSNRSGNGHGILLRSYDEINQTFVVHDPLKKKASILSLQELSEKWPHKYSDKIIREYKLSNRYYLKAQKLNLKMNSDVEFSFDPPPTGIVNKTTPESFVNLQLPTSVKSFPAKLKDAQKLLGDHVNLRYVSKHWKKGTKAENIIGLATWLKLKAAAKEPAIVFFKKNGGDKLFPAAITGYDKSVFSLEGSKFQLSTLVDGEVVSKWIDCQEVLTSCATTDSGGKYCFPVAYPKVSLASPPQK